MYMDIDMEVLPPQRGQRFCFEANFKLSRTSLMYSNIIVMSSLTGQHWSLRPHRAALPLIMYSGCNIYQHAFSGVFPRGVLHFFPHAVTPHDKSSIIIPVADRDPLLFQDYYVTFYFTELLVRHYWYYSQLHIQHY